MFEPLFARLADRFHLGPRLSGLRTQRLAGPKKITYTFDHFAEIMKSLHPSTWAGARHALLQDYGGPVGFRMALAHPEHVDALSFKMRSRTTKVWARTGKRGEFWKDRAANENTLCTNLLSLQTTRTVMSERSQRGALIDPDLWTDEFYFLNQPDGPNSERSFLRLSNERGRISEVASLDAREAAAPACHLGEV